LLPCRRRERQGDGRPRQRRRHVVTQNKERDGLAQSIDDLARDVVSTVQPPEMTGEPRARCDRPSARAPFHVDK
jgi:hypothetical protein